METSVRLRSLEKYAKLHTHDVIWDTRVNKSGIVRVGDELYGFGIGGVSDWRILGYERGPGNGTADWSLGDAHVQKLSAITKQRGHQYVNQEQNYGHAWREVQRECGRRPAIHAECPALGGGLLIKGAVCLSGYDMCSMCNLCS